MTKNSNSESRTFYDRLEEHFADFAEFASTVAGSFWAFVIAASAVLIWAATGPAFAFSSSWQLVVNTATTIITFLMVFLIQHSQNKDMLALQLKLNELIAASEGASNRLIDLENLSDREIDALYKRFQHLAQNAERLKPGAKTSVDTEE